MSTAYKSYTGIRNERLMVEIEWKLSESQVGFRKERGTADAIYVLNYVVNRETSITKGKVYVFFADLKEAFDKINRGKLEERMREMGVTVRLRKRIMGTYSTRNVVER